MKEMIFASQESGERLDKFLDEMLPDFSRSYLQKLIKGQHVTVQGQIVKPNYRLRAEDEIHIEIPDEIKLDITPEKIPLDILYEDQDLLVINKPKGMVVHPAAGHYSGTLVRHQWRFAPWHRSSY